jgi:hypothetical protein
MKDYVRDSPERALLAGICWVDEELIAVRVAQLSKIAKISKTQINEALTWISKEALPISAERRTWLIAIIPQLDDGSHLRDWSFRRLVPYTPGDHGRLNAPEPIGPVVQHCAKVTPPLPPIGEISDHFVTLLGPGCGDLPSILEGLSVGR